MKIALTAREREVAALVAEGLTNREIAGRLVVSERTAEYHVEQIRNKLGVRSRAQVAAWFAAAAEAHAGPLKTGRPARRPPPRPPRGLVGRQDAYGALIAIAGAAVAGNGRAALLVGEAGSGKTRLLTELAAAARESGLLALHGVSSSAEGHLAYEIWTEALAPTAPEATILPPPWPSALTALLPGLHPAPIDDGVSPELRRKRLFEAVVRLLARIAEERAVLLCLDDLQYADTDSLHLLHYVVRNIRGRPVALVGAIRPMAADTASSTAIRELEASSLLVRVPVTPLGSGEVIELVEHGAVDPDTARWLGPRIHAWSGGNPFFALQALSALTEQGHLRERDGRLAWQGAVPAATEPLGEVLPRGVRAALLARLGALPEPTRRVLGVGSVVGSAFHPRTIAAVTGDDELSVVERLEPAINAEILREVALPEGPGLAFMHELIRDATYQALPAVTRVALHRRAGSVLEGAPAAIVAHHLAQAGDAAAAADRWLAAAREGTMRFAYDDALRSYRAVLALIGERDGSRASVLESIGDTERARGASQAAVDAFDAALREAADGDARVRLSVKIAHVVGRYEGKHAEAMTLAETAVAALEPRGDTPDLAEALLALAWMRYLVNDPEGARVKAERALALSRALDLPRLETSAHEVRTRARWLSGDHIALPAAADVDRLVARLGDDDGVPHLRWLQAMALIRNGDAATALAVAEHGIGVARRVGSLDGELEDSEPAIWALSVLGRYADAVALGDETLRIAERIGMPRWPRASGDYLVALVLAGEEERFVEVAREIIAGAPSYPASPHNRSPLFALSGMVALGRCAEAPAEALVRERSTCKTCQVSWLAIVGRREAICGDPRAALETADAFERHVQETRFHFYMPMSEHIRALAFARLGRGEEAERAVARARSAYAALNNVAGPDLLARELAALSLS